MIGRASRPAFHGVLALVFVASAGLTIAWSASMSATGGMPMPGGWTMSMAWMRMPGQTWAGAAASFVGMWVVMMVAMMLPSVVPVLSRYRRALTGTGASHPGWLTSLVAGGYFSFWSVVGTAVFPLGIAVATAEMQLAAVARAVPAATGIVFLVAGALQFTRWKAHHLACWQQLLGGDPRVQADARTAWRQGLHLGAHCCCCCANLMALLLALGVMDLRAMAAVTTAITLERLAPAERTARVIGVVVVAAGVFLIARAVVPG